MKLFEDKFEPFFSDSELQKFKEECLRKSLMAFNIKNGNVPKWSDALNKLNATKKGERSK